MMYYYNYGEFLPFHLFGFILMILFWGLIIYGVILLFHKLSPGSTDDKGRALDILKERYAKGEITKDQFEAMKKDIQ